MPCTLYSMPCTLNLLPYILYNQNALLRYMNMRQFMCCSMLQHVYRNVCIFVVLLSCMPYGHEIFQNVRLVFNFYINVS